MKGIAYGAGVGPGDPELMTRKVVRLIQENEIIAVPGKAAEQSAAYQIAVQAVPELKDKTLVPVEMPMVSDRELVHRYHLENARMLEQYLDQGKNVVYLTLGDSTIYCTFTYLQAILEEDGYETQLVNGIPSFCAAAARLNIPIAEWDEEIHIIPAFYKKDQTFDQPGNYILMKSASHMKEVKQMLQTSGRKVAAVENCGMEKERLFYGTEEIPDDAGYFSLIIAKEAADNRNED